jgi:macrodomain Ter protein organizer (MatP/YcbG family)
MRQTKRKRIEFTIVSSQEPKLAALVKRWGINRSNTLRYIIGEAYQKARAEDRKARRA